MPNEQNPLDRREKRASPWTGKQMALRIRLQRLGRRHRPLYRLVVAEALARRDGRFVENLGDYNPSPRGRERRLLVHLDRVDHWLGVGAQPSETVRALIREARSAASAGA
jgi:small subunit ribosomal protein S16